MGLGGNTLDTNTLLLELQKNTVQYVTVSLSAVSVLCCIVSLYWFVLMRRNFRRTLIMLLLFADLSKSLWFMLFPVVSLSVGGIKTGDAVCDLGGFALQASIESCDIAILLMSIHMSLQVFNPNSSRIGPDGLYRYRHAVYVIWVILPSFMAALAFVRSGAGSYLSQGAFCSLAIRPYWYRLALSWIPRYLIWLYITFTAVRIYLHVGTGFTVFARVAESDSNASCGSSAPTFSNAPAPPAILNFRRPSHVVFSLQSPFANGTTDSARSPRPAQEARPADDVLGPEDQEKLRQGSQLTNASSHVIDYGAAEIARGGDNSREALVNIMPTADATAAMRRRAIQRQTRLLFIYPCVYLILMIAPFIQHCFNYSDYYAQRPIFALSVLTPLCYSIMGTADCLIFGWREKPWTLMPGSDGTFLGSFCFWRFIGPWANASPTIGTAAFEKAARQYRAPDARRGSVDPALFRPTPAHMRGAVAGTRHSSGASGGSVGRQVMNSIKSVRMGHRRVFSGNSDQAAQAAERAAERLALERAAHTQRVGYFGVSGSSQAGTPVKEWFDREDVFGPEDENEDEEAAAHREEEEHEVADGEDLDPLSVSPRRNTRTGEKALPPTNTRRGWDDLSPEHERRMRDFGAM